MVTKDVQTALVLLGFKPHPADMSNVFIRNRIDKVWCMKLDEFTVHYDGSTSIPFLLDLPKGTNQKERHWWYSHTDLLTILTEIMNAN